MSLIEGEGRGLLLDGFTGVLDGVSEASCRSRIKHVPVFLEHDGKITGVVA
jgi:hypothetical protein